MRVDSESNVAFVIPCYNEEHRLNIEYWRQFVGEVPALYLFVDDGSNDRTYEVLKNLEGKLSGRVNTFSLQINRGKAEAIRLGFQEILKNYQNVELVGYLDSDTSINPEDAKRILGIARDLDFDVVMGSRVKLLGRLIYRNPIRHLIGRTIVTFLSIGAHDFPYDSQCGIKVFRKCNDLQLALEENFKTRWFVDLEIMLNLKALTSIKIWEEPLNHWTESGGSRLRLTHSFRVLKELAYIKRRMRQNWT